LFGKTEVGNARLPVGIDQHIGRFEVAVQRTALMGVLHRLRQSPSLNRAASAGATDSQSNSSDKFFPST
jgi:hypothetical protein